MIKSKRHHFVPQFYLKPWCNNVGNLEGYLRNEIGEIISFCRSPRSVAFEEGLYTLKTKNIDDPAIIEKWFGNNVESRGKHIRDKLIRDGAESLTIEEKAIWAKFLLAQIARVPNKIIDLCKKAKIELKKAFDENPAEYQHLIDDPSLFHWLVENGLDMNDLLLGTLIEFLEKPKYTSLISDMHWLVRDLSTSNHRIVTSDRPIFIYPNLNTHSCVLALPLSPKYVFFSTHSKTVFGSLKDEKFSKLARQCNTSIIQQAERFVIGHIEKNFVERHLSSHYKDPKTY